MVDEELLQILNELGIYPEKIYKQISGCECIILPVEIKGKKIYFKFLTNKSMEEINNEVNFVNYLKQNNVNVQQYYSNEDKCVFVYDKYVIYGTYDAGKMLDVNLVDVLMIYKIIENLATMHKISSNFYNCNNGIDDGYRLVEFIEANSLFIKKYQLDNIVEKVLKFKNLTFDNHILIHADLNFRNITQNGCFIDFTDLRIGKKEDDIGKLFQNILSTKYNSIEDLEKFISYYESVFGEKIDISELLISTVYRLIYRFYCSLQDGFSENNYKEMTKSLNIVNDWLGGFTNDKRSCLQNN